MGFVIDVKVTRHADPALIIFVVLYKAHTGVLFPRTTVVLLQSITCVVFACYNKWIGLNIKLIIEPIDNTRV